MTKIQAQYGDPDPWPEPTWVMRLDFDPPTCESCARRRAADMAEAVAVFIEAVLGEPSTIGPLAGTDGTDGTVPRTQDDDRSLDLMASAEPPKTMLDFAAPICETCGRRKRAVVGQAGRYVCPFPHRVIR